MRLPRYVVCSAWPYVNNVPHLGTMIGSLLSGDVYARFLKLMGESVIYVSGSDEHGSPIEVEARKAGISPKELTDAMHEYIVKVIREWNIEFTNYTRTHNPTHIRFVQDFLMKIYNNGLIRPRSEVLPYCPVDKIFLADRFIEGTCPKCGYEKARGDQCENCGGLLHPTELISSRCTLCGTSPEYRETVHWFFDLPRLKERLLEWLKGHEMLLDNVKNYSIKWVEEGLKERSVTRDSEWGIQAPFPGAENKTIYVWFDALLGYLSAVKEYYEKAGMPEEFERTWLNPETRTVYFIGKDNIPFHAIILPALLMAAGDSFPLPWQISATEYLLFQEEKFSKSRGIGVWADEALEILPPDYWRFALMRMRPEAKDISFNWREFYRIVNTELNDDIGNFIHRVLSFIWKRYGGVVPGPGNESDIDLEFKSSVMELVDKTIESYETFKLKSAAEAIVEISRRGNQYLNRRAPWELVKTSPKSAEAVLYIGANVVRVIALLMYPITPESSTSVYRMLGLEGPTPGELKNAKELAIKPGHKINEPKPLFTKLPEDFLDRIGEIVAEARRKAEAKRPKIVRWKA